MPALLSLAFFYLNYIRKNQGKNNPVLGSLPKENSIAEKDFASINID
jgi:hypothetical protein